VFEMLQAEVGSAKIMANRSFPTRGHLMIDFTLPSGDGKQISLYDYRGRSSMVLFFAATPEASEEEALLSSLVRHYNEIREQDSEVLLVLPSSRDRADRVRRRTKAALFPVLADEGMHVYKSVGAFGALPTPAPALFVTDCFMEVHAAWRVGAGDSLPGVKEVLSWLAYLDSVCPECTQAEWPKED
jgi:peroxiredoxin